MLSKSYDVIAGILAGLGVLLIYYFSALAISEDILPRSYEYIFNLAVAVIGAFAGAFAAFRFQAYREFKERLKSKTDTLNRALFVIGSQINAILLIKRDIEPWRENPSAFVEMPAILGSDYAELKIDVMALQFLLDHEANLLFELSILQQKFEATIRIAKIRSSFHINHLQPALSDAKYNDRHPTLPNVAAAVGERIAVTAYKSTNDVFEMVDSTLKALEEEMGNLRRIAIEYFPGPKYIGFEFDGI